MLSLDLNYYLGDNENLLLIFKSNNQLVSYIFQL